MDCAGDLVCFQRDGDKDIPGCSGSGVSDYDYCVNLGLNDLGAYPVLLTEGKKHGRCEGNCDKDADCAGDLVCFQRDGDKYIPGCNGSGARDHDYCIDP